VGRDRERGTVLSSDVRTLGVVTDFESLVLVSVWPWRVLSSCGRASSLGLGGSGVLGTGVIVSCADLVHNYK